MSRHSAAAPEFIKNKCKSIGAAAFVYYFLITTQSQGKCMKIKLYLWYFLENRLPMMADQLGSSCRPFCCLQGQFKSYVCRLVLFDFKKLIESSVCFYFSLYPPYENNLSSPPPHTKSVLSSMFICGYLASITFMQNIYYLITNLGFMIIMVIWLCSRLMSYSANFKAFFSIRKKC